MFFPSLNKLFMPLLSLLCRLTCAATTYSHMPLVLACTAYHHNAPTSCKRDYHQSLTPSYALQLFSKAHYCNLTDCSLTEFKTKKFHFSSSLSCPSHGSSLVSDVVCRLRLCASLSHPFLSVCKLCHLESWSNHSSKSRFVQSRFDVTREEK